MRTLSACSWLHEQKILLNEIWSSYPGGSFPLRRRSQPQRNSPASATAALKDSPALPHADKLAYSPLAPASWVILKAALRAARQLRRKAIADVKDGLRHQRRRNGPFELAADQKSLYRRLLPATEGPVTGQPSITLWTNTRPRCGAVQQQAPPKASQRRCATTASTAPAPSRGAIGSGRQARRLAPRWSSPTPRAVTTMFFTSLGPTPQQWAAMSRAEKRRAGHVHGPDALWIR